MGKGKKLTIHGGRHLLPREQVAFAIIFLFGIHLLLASAGLGFQHLRKGRHIPAVTSACILTLSILRIALAGMELNQDPLDTRRPRREQDFATLDAVALAPVMLTLLSHLVDYVHFSSVKCEEGLYASVKKWQLISLGALSLLATAVYVAGCIVAFQVDRDMPQVLQAGALLYVVMGLLLLAAALKLPMESKARRMRILSVMTGVMTVRLVWAVASAWSVDSMESRLSPYRATTAGTWTHLGMVLVMEYMASFLCLWFGGYEKSLAQTQYMRV